MLSKITDADLDFWMRNRRWCYTVPAVQNTSLYGGYVPSMVIEGIEGHWPMTGQHDGAPWVWGTTLEEAERACDAKNELLGFDRKTAWLIQASTLPGSKTYEETK